MEITVTQATNPAVTIMTLVGDLDGSNYENVIARARDIHADGARNLLIDMGQVPYMSSAGLVALHSLALLMNNEELPDPEDGWAALRAVRQSIQAGQQTRVKLLAPLPQVVDTLETTGLIDFFEIYDDLGAAVAAY